MSTIFTNKPNPILDKKPVLLRVPELTLLLAVTLLSYLIITVSLYYQPESEGLQLGIAAIMFGSFLLSLFIAIVAVIGGIGGGVIFTTLMLGFTSIDTLVVRSTGLVVAMFSGLVSSGPLMRSGMADIKLVFFGAIPVILGSIIGAYSAIYLADQFGETGDALVRLLLGLITIGLAFVFIKGGKHTDYPENTQHGKLAKLIGLQGWYWDMAIAKEVQYKVRRGRYGLILLFLVGFIGGFFGLGGGWAVTPVYNLMMFVPLKLAAGCSGVLLALGNAAAIWPYILVGALFPLFVVPWMAGQVIGGIIGAHLLARANAALVRKTLIVLLILTSLKLISRGIEGLFNISIPLL